MRKRHGLILRRANELSSIKDQTVHLAGFGWGYLRQRGTDPSDVRTWFEVVHGPADLTCQIHPAQVQSISGLHQEWAAIRITLKHIRAIEQLVDVRSGECLAEAGDRLDNDTAARWLSILDGYRMDGLGIPTCCQRHIAWDWIEAEELT